MRHKTVQLIETKADGSGTFTALASVFGNVDVVGDRMMKGAFRKTLDNFRAAGDPIPVILSHDWSDPFAMIGKADPNDVVETDDGLVVKGHLDIADNPVAKQVHKLMKDRRLKGWSFGYTVPEGGEKRGEDGANEVFEVDLIEVGPTLKGANPEAQLQTIKSALEVETSEDVPDEEVEDPTPAEPPQIEDADEEPKAKSRAQDPLRQASLATALEVLSDGASLRKYVEDKPPEPDEGPSQEAQRRRLVDLIL